MFIEDVKFEVHIATVSHYRSLFVLTDPLKIVIFNEVMDRLWRQRVGKRYWTELTEMKKAGRGGER